MERSGQALSRRSLLVGLTAGALAGVHAAVTGAVEVGQPAPDFLLPATTGGKIGLSQFRGKQPVLIEFYGNDFAPV